MSEGTSEITTFPTIGQRAERARILERKTPDGFSIQIEPGLHPVTDQQRSALRQEVLSGNYEAHSWNREVAERMTVYQPEIVSIDGDIVTYGEQVTEDDFLLSLWTVLPAEPSKLNRSGKILVLRTEQLTPYSMKEALIGNGHDAEQVEQIFNGLMSVDLNNMRGFDEFKSNQDTKLVLALLGVAAGAGLFASTKLNMMHRRELLKKALAIVGGMAAAGSGFEAIKSLVDIDNERVRRQQPFSPEETQLLQNAAVAQTPDEKNAFILQHDANFNGHNREMVAVRNAQFSLKTKGAYDQLAVRHDVPSTIVAGRDHLPGMSAILASDDHAEEVLRNYVSNGIFALVDNYYAQALPAGTTHTMTDRQMKSLLIDFISLTAIDTVVDPDRTLFKSNPLQAIRSAYTFGKVYTEPRVKAALDPLLV